MIAIGVDPGSHRTGYGVVRRDGARLVRLASGVIKTDPKTDPKDPNFDPEKFDDLKDPEFKKF